MTGQRCLLVALTVAMLTAVLAVEAAEADKIERTTDKNGMVTHRNVTGRYSCMFNCDHTWMNHPCVCGGCGPLLKKADTDATRAFPSNYNYACSWHDSRCAEGCSDCRCCETC